MFSFDAKLYSKVEVIHNALPDESNELPLDGKAFPADRPARILYLSNLIESKGYLLLLEAIRILVRERGRAVEAHFCGEFVPENGAHFADSVNRMEREFRDKVEAGGLQDYVHYHGAVTGESKRAVLNRSDFFVLPTQYPNEGQPVSIIEAMAHGLVVLATPIAAIPDTINDGVGGVLISPRPVAIADALEQLLDQRERFRAISSGAVQRYRKLYTQDAHLSAIIPCITGGDSFSRKTA
jgi:glycosyltransferase involved in cell wall biosynthesis